MPTAGMFNDGPFRQSGAAERTFQKGQIVFGFGKLQGEVAATVVFRIKFPANFQMPPAHSPLFRGRNDY
jgi:hypothetical protein